MNISWRDAIIKVLSEEQRAMHYSEISELILSRGYYNTSGATPDATVNSQITTSIKQEGQSSPFIKVSKGTYALQGGDPPEPGVNTLPKAPTACEANTSQSASSEVAPLDDQDESIIRSLGMYWQRDLVVWKAKPRIYGKQQALSKPVDFSEQRGVYILYDHHTVVYVGRSVDRPLGQRLFEHTADRIGSRWNRFSWFGLRRVTDEGALEDVELTISYPSLIRTFEALLIEALEPPQNRKRGDDFTSMEYIQDIDPELKERELQQTLRAIEQKLRGEG
jgi:hypothetical protein